MQSNVNSNTGVRKSNLNLKNVEDFFERVCSLQNTFLADKKLSSTSKTKNLVYLYSKIVYEQNKMKKSNLSNYSSEKGTYP